MTYILFGDILYIEGEGEKLWLVHIANYLDITPAHVQTLQAVSLLPITLLLSNIFLNWTMDQNRMVTGYQHPAGPGTLTTTYRLDARNILIHASATHACLGQLPWVADGVMLLLND